MAITPDKLNKIKRIIKEHTGLFIEFLVGGNPTELAKKLGISPKDLDLIGYAYAYGKLEAMTGQDISKMSPAKVAKLVDAVKLTKKQQQVADWLKSRSQVYAESFGDRLTANIVSTLVNDQLQQYDLSAQSVSATMKQMRDDTKDFARDWHRIVQTETWDSKLHGMANAIEDKQGAFSGKGKETMVAKRPHPDCCPQCRKHYLMPDGITPRVFKLSDLQANGTNIGKKTRDWKPVLGTMHPYCGCVLFVVPDGYHFNSAGQLEPDKL